MKCPSCTRHPRGFAVTEVVVGVVLIALIAVLAARAIFDYQRAVVTSDWNRSALWAAQAQLLRFQAGAPLDSAPPAGLIAEEIKLSTADAAGRGQWQGFRQLTVTAEGTSPAGRPFRAQVSGYVQNGGRP